MVSLWQRAKRTHRWATVWPRRDPGQHHQQEADALSAGDPGWPGTNRSERAFSDPRAIDSFQNLPQAHSWVKEVGKGPGGKQGFFTLPRVHKEKYTCRHTHGYTHSHRSTRTHSCTYKHRPITCMHSDMRSDTHTGTHRYIHRHVHKHTHTQMPALTLQVTVHSPDHLPQSPCHPLPPQASCP